MDLNKKIKIGKKELSYNLQRRRGSKSVKLSLHSDGYVSVTAPRWYPLYLIEKFIQEKSQWIFENIAGTDFVSKNKSEQEDYKKLKEEARNIIKNKIIFFNQFYNFSFGRVAIKKQRSCWGSCSQKKNLNFNYKIIKLPADLQDYIIVHELCHLKELNHSQRFWQLVAQQIPDFLDKKNKLRKIKI